MAIDIGQIICTASYLATLAYTVDVHLLSSNSNRCSSVSTCGEFSMHVLNSCLKENEKYWIITTIDDSTNLENQEKNVVKNMTKVYKAVKLLLKNNLTCYVNEKKS